MFTVNLRIKKKRLVMATEENENKMKKKITEKFPFLSMFHIIQTVRVWRALILFISVSPGG